MLQLCLVFLKNFTFDKEPNFAHSVPEVFISFFKKHKLLTENNALFCILINFECKWSISVSVSEVYFKVESGVTWCNFQDQTKNKNNHAWKKFLMFFEKYYTRENFLNFRKKPDSAKSHLKNFLYFPHAVVKKFLVP